MKLKDVLDLVFEDIENGWKKQFTPGQVYSDPFHTSFNQLNEDVKRVKISITLNPKIIKKLENDIINKSKLIEKLLTEYYGNKNL